MKKQRKKGQPAQPVAEPKVESVPVKELISFETFFLRSVRLDLVRREQHDEVATFFKIDCKLRDKEELEVFQAALKRY